MKKQLDFLLTKIFNYIYKKQAEFHRKKMEKLKKEILKGRNCAGEKFHTSAAATLTIKSKKEKLKKANEAHIERLVNSFMDNPKKFFEFIENKNTPVYVVKQADKILSNLKEPMCFILPKKGLKALYLNLVLNKKIDFKTPEMFIIKSYNVNPYILAYQFYKWYCYKMKLDGYEIKTQEKFKHIFTIYETLKINTLSYSEILGLKSAVKRDIEAIEFVQKLARNKSMAKKNLERLKQGEKVSV